MRISTLFSFSDKHRITPINFISKENVCSIKTHFYASVIEFDAYRFDCKIIISINSNLNTRRRRKKNSWIFQYEENVEPFEIYVR